MQQSTDTNYCIEKDKKLPNNNLKIFVLFGCLVLTELETSYGQQ